MTAKEAIQAFINSGSCKPGPTLLIDIAALCAAVKFEAEEAMRVKCAKVAEEFVMDNLGVSGTQLIVNVAMNGVAREIAGKIRKESQ